MDKAWREVSLLVHKIEKTPFFKFVFIYSKAFQVFYKMGRQTEKSKQKQFKIKEERKRYQIASAQVKKANEIYDPLADFKVFNSYKNNDLEIMFECKPVKDVNEEDFENIMNIMRFNMKRYYENCSWGWNEDLKKSEMTESNARYLIARDADSKIVGFSHFRFDLEHKLSCLYLYELQLDLAVRRKKLGQFMMKILELMAFKNNMEKVVLTVFKHNDGALSFFSKQGYALDEYSPEDCYEEQFPYFIFSKLNKNYNLNLV